MYSITASNVNEALSHSINLLLTKGVKESSRNGPVIVIPKPICVEFVNPRQRVLFSSTRDANPFFHFMEFLWFMSGSNDIEFPCFFNKSYAQFSDDGSTMWDSYGHRWLKFFGWDQLDGIVNELISNSTSRRCVLSMWNSFAQADYKHPLQAETWCEDFGLACGSAKAVPCNTHAYFAIRNGKLNMTVMNRSNDLIWGMLGANAVHFSFLLEYMAMRIGIPVGSYFQFTNNLHCYTDKFSTENLLRVESESGSAAAIELGYEIELGFDEDLALFMPWALQVIRSPAAPPTWRDDEPTPPGILLTGAIPELKTPFFHAVTVPMFLTWVFRKWKDEYSSQVCLDGIDAPDWQKACGEWVDRRAK